MQQKKMGWTRVAFGATFFGVAGLVVTAQEQARQSQAQRTPGGGNKAGLTTKRALVAAQLDWCGTEKQLTSGRTRGANDCPTGFAPDVPATRDASIPTSSTPFKTIRLRFHVLANDDGSNLAATSADVDATVAQMNSDFNSARIRFTFTQRQVNDTQYASLPHPTDDTSNVMDAMKNAYVESPDSQLNVFVTTLLPLTADPTKGLLGIATFPWDSDALQRTGGVVMNSVAGGAMGAGTKTLTHEVGHALGLWHTHRGVSDRATCSDCFYEPAGRTAAQADISGDLCSDTLPTPVNFTCADPVDNPSTMEVNEAVDGCSTNPWGTTPFRNYMGYANDSCLTNFTPQQMGRMHAWIGDKLTGLLTAQGVSYTYTGNAHYGRDDKGACVAGAGGGSVINWHDGRNWAAPCSSAGPPGAGDSAHIGNFTVEVNSNVTVANLTFDPTPTNGQAHMNIAVNNSATLTITDTFTWKGGGLGATPGFASSGGRGTLRIAPGAQWLLNSPTRKEFSQGVTTVVNDGTATWSEGNLHIYQTNEGIINNGVFTATSDADMISDSALIYPTSGFINNGTLRKSGGTGTTSIGWIFKNHGLLDAQSGIISLTGIYATDSNTSTQGHDGTFQTAAGAFIDFAGSYQNLSSAARFVGAGRTRIVTGGYVDTHGTPQIGTPAQPGNFEIAGGYFNHDVNTLDSSGALVCSNTGKLYLSGGYIGGPINVQDGAMATWTGGELDGVLNIAQGATLHIKGSGTRTINGYGLANYGDQSLPGILNNDGTTIWSETANIDIDYGNPDNDTRGVINNTGLFIAQNDQLITGGVFKNTGIFRKTSSSGITSFGSPANSPNADSCLKNSGTLDTQTGILNIGSGTHYLNEGSQFTGAGRTRLDGGALGYPLIASGNFTIENGATFELTGGNLTAPLGTTPAPPANFNGPGTFLWTGGNVSAELNIGNGTIFEISGANSKTIYGANSNNVNRKATINNRGTATWTGTGQLTHFTGYFAQFNNLGTFNVQTDALTNLPLTNSGTVNVGTPTAPRIWNQAYTFTQTATGKLNIDIGGADAATPQFDQIKTNANSVIGGTLNVNFINGYSPPDGTVFRVLSHLLSYTTSSGTFSSLKVTGGGSKTVLPTYGPNFVDLTVQTINLSLNDVSILEGNTGTSTLNFTATLSMPSSQPVTVNYTTLNSTATQPGDYSARSGTLTIPAGVTRGVISIPIIGDTLDEVDESFFLNLSAVNGAVLADNQGRATIIDNDAKPTLSIADAAVTEGNSGTTNAAFTINLSAPSGQRVSVNAITANGTARSPADYTGSGVNLVFEPGQTSKTFNVPVKGDAIDEVNEIFYVLLSSPANAAITRGRAVGTITDDDAAPTISIDNLNIGEGNTGQRTAAIRLRLSAPSGQAVRVTYATASGTASPGNDYVQVAPSVITFNVGGTVAYARVLINGDLLNEPNETFLVNLSSPQNATIADSQAVGTILNDDSAPALTVNDVAIEEGNIGTKQLTFTVTLTKASGQSISVNYATANGTALSTSDYAAKTGTLTFAPGSALTQNISIIINGDAIVENNENFYVFLSNATNASIGKARGVGTITNDDTSG